MRPRARELAATLGLEPHPEGGFFRESYRADETVATPRGERPLSTAIVFLVTADAISHMHRLTSDELWVFQGGLPLELVTIAEDGQLIRRVLGEFEEGGDEELLPQALVPAGSWQGARLAGGPHLQAEHAWALVSCVVTPGFDFADFELGDRDALVAAHPEHAALIRELT
jgi:uncharacterized protein